MLPSLACVLLAALPCVEPRQETGQVLAGDPLARLDEGLRHSLAGLDPNVDGWSSEARSDAVGPQLARLAAWLEGAPEARSDAAALGVFAEGFRARVPRTDGDLVHQAVLFQVQLDPGADVEVDAAGFLAFLARPLAGVHEVHAKIKQIKVEAEGAEFTTQVILLVSAERGVSELQWNGWWSCRWSPGEGDAPPLLAGMEVLGHELVSEEGPRLYSDASEQVFGGTAAWAEELVPGLAEWRSRLDTRLGVPMLGHAAGIAVGDVDGDGLEDLYLCQPGGLPNKLFLHQPDGTVRDRSAEAGVDFLDFSRAALLVDLDGDGDRDLAVNAAERLLLLANDGRGRFWLQAALDAPDATSLAAADVDLDGDLDLYVCAYASPYDHSALPVPYHDAHNGRPNHLLENQGDWIFVDATAARGLDHNNDRFSFAASFEDYDDDGDPDLYVANDFGRNNLYRNDGGSFTDVAAEAGVEDVAAGMGVSWGDADGDGRFDLYVSNMYSSAGNRIAYQRRFQEGASEEVREEYQRHAHGNTLFLNDGGGRFRDATMSGNPLGLAMGRWAWGALFADVDGDGWQDLLSPNGFLTEERNTDL